MRAESPHKKIISLASASKKVREYQAKGLSVGCISGSFDIITAIHFKALEVRSKKCDVLILLLNSDVSVRGYKGSAKPILDETERAYTVAQSPFVKYIVLFDSLTPIPLLAKIKPDIFFNVGEWGADCVEKKTVEDNGGSIQVFNFVEPPTWSKSTTELLQRIAVSESKQVAKAIFLDRDGVLNENKNGYIYKWEDITIKPHVIPTLKAFQKAGYKLIIITNQSGIARGYYTEQQMHKLHKRMLQYFSEQAITIDAVYYCPHGPHDRCECRKPNIGMLVTAAKEQNLNLSKSWFIGDSDTDVIAGRMANVKTIYIGEKESYGTGAILPNFFVGSMRDAQGIILKK